MQKLSGLVLDVYDDQGGEVLQSIFPTHESLPNIVKEAHFLSEEERGALPSDVFALELVDEENSLRKFACTDAGNTALSVEYFLKTAHKLPEEAQKVAAQNLLTACSWYDLDPPEELQKVALVGGLAKGLAGVAARTAKKHPGAVLGAVMTPAMVASAAKPRLQVAKQLGGKVSPAVLKAPKMGM